MPDLSTLALQHISDSLLTDKALFTYGSAVFFTMIVVFIRVVGPLVSMRYRAKTESKKVLFETRICSMVHLFPVLIWVFKTLYENPNDFVNDPVYGFADSFVFSFSTGYFIWDILENVVFFHSVAFMLHGVVCVVLYSIVMKPVVQYYGCLFLLYEISTFFMNLSWMFGEMGWKAVQKSMLMLFALSFFIVRICFGLYWTYHIRKDVYDITPETTNELDYYFIQVIWYGTYFFPVLNFYWMIQIILVATKKSKAE